MFVENYKNFGVGESLRKYTNIPMKNLKNLKFIQGKLQYFCLNGSDGEGPGR